MIEEETWLPSFRGSSIPLAVRYNYDHHSATVTGTGYDPEPDYVVIHPVLGNVKMSIARRYDLGNRIVSFLQNPESLNKFY